MIPPDAPMKIRVGRALEDSFFGKREEWDDFVSVMMANHARKVMQAMRVPDMAMTLAFHSAVGRPVGVSAEEVWAAMIDAAIGEPAAPEDDD